MNIKTSAVLCMLAFLSAVPSKGWAVDVYQCPSKLRVSSAVEDNSSGLEAVSFDQEHNLVTSTFSDGPPVDSRYLNPVSSTKKDRSQLHTYKLSGLVSERAWLVCRYGTTTAVLVKKMPKVYKACLVKESWDGSDQRVECE